MIFAKWRHWAKGLMVREENILHLVTTCMLILQVSMATRTLGTVGVQIAW